MINANRKALAYIRVSTTDQKDKGYSLPDQRDKITRYCESKGIEIQEFYEEDYSAKTFNRPKFNSLLAYAKKHKKDIDYLIFVKWDRFSRDISGAYQMLDTFQTLNIECQAIEQWLDYKIPENKLMLSIYIAQPMVDNDRRSLNTKNGMRRAQLSGRYMATAPVGYKNARDEHGKSIIIADSTVLQPSGRTKSELLNALFVDFSSGNYQQEEVRMKYWKLGLRITKSRIKPTLLNPTYIGKLKVKATDDEPEQIVQGLHDPLVADDTFFKVQSILNNSKKDKSKYSKRNNDFPLRGELTCKKCNKPLTGSFSKGRSGKKFGYYHCIHPCKSRVANNKMDEWVEKTLRKIRPNAAVNELYEEVLKKELRLKNGDIEKELLNIHTQLDTTQAKLESLEEKFIDNQIDAETYKKWKSKFTTELSGYAERSKQLNLGFKETIERLKEATKIISQLPSLYKSASPVDKKTIVGSIFSEKLSIDKNEIQTAHFNQVVELICAPSLNKGGFKNKNGNARDEHSRRVTSERFKLPTS